MSHFGWSLRGAIAVGAVCLVATATPAWSNDLYSNGFEVDTTDWASTSRVATGTNGITSASGSFHGEALEGAFTRWGGYNFGAGNAVPTAFLEYTTSVDIFLDVAGGWANNTRFDFSSAINNAAGTHLRDFIFNAGFYNDATGPGANTDRFVISASNTAQPGSAFAKNPARDPIAIATAGWYTFEHHFYNNAGTLAVDMSIFDTSSALVNSWTLSDPVDLIAGVGGNRYGWVNYNQFPFLAVDNASLATVGVPEPASMALLALGLAGLGVVRRRR